MIFIIREPMKTKKALKIITVLILCVCLAASPDMISFAAAGFPTTGRVTSASGTTLYDGAGYPPHQKVEWIANGTEFIAVGEEYDKDGDLWYKINYGEGYSKTAYIYSGRCKLDPYVAPDYDDPQFDSQMEAEGFPESYRTLLKSLHAIYPKWEFHALKTGLDWTDVLNGETQPAINLVPTSWADSYKSYESGSYDWNSSSFIVYDTGRWVNASRETIAYYMDPRNFIDRNYIFQFLSLGYTSSESADGVKSVLSGSFMDGAYPSGKEDSGRFATYADAFVAAARESGVSAYHLASRALQEQGYSGSKLGLGTVSGYEGWYNIFNYGASGQGADNVLKNGAQYAKNNGWNTPYKSILGAAKNIASKYIGRGQVNTYLQKFDVVDGGDGFYRHQYMQNVAAPSSEASKTKGAFSAEQLNTLPLSFVIPIYENMPNSACAKPPATGNNNNLLNSLSVDGYSIGTFDRYYHIYELVVEENVDAITIRAQKADSGATVSGDGTVRLNYGDNTFPVTVTATNGVSRTYNLYVHRKGTGGVPPVVTSLYYSVGDYITGITPGTGVSDFLNNISSDKGSLSLLNSAGAAKTSGTVATGDLLSVTYDGSKTLKIPLVIYGDINGDGVINTLDLLRGHKYILGAAGLDAASLKAADMNKDGVFNTVDLLRGQKYILGLIADLQK